LAGEDGAAAVGRLPFFSAKREIRESAERERERRF
jgi:hypothetical protein